jgi:chloride channel 2
LNLTPVPFSFNHFAADDDDERKIKKMYGRYSRSLGEYARQQAAELREAEKNRKKEEKQRSKELRTYRGKWTSRFLRVISFIWRHTFAKIGEDWVFLALLGIIVAMFSYIMDYGIVMCNNGMFIL